MGKTTITTNNISETKLPEWMSKGGEDLWNRANANVAAQTPYTKYGNARIAALTPDELAGMQLTRDNVGSWKGDMDKSGAALDRVNALTIDDVTADQVGTDYNADRVGTDYNADLVTADTVRAGNLDVGALGDLSIDSLGNIRDVTAERIAQAKKWNEGAAKTYMDPYNNLVLADELAEMQRQRQIQIKQNASDAAKQGAWGGKRAGVTQAETQNRTQELINQQINRSKSGAYNKAFDMFTSDENRDTDISKSNQDAMLRAGIANQGADTTKFNMAGDFAKTKYLTAADFAKANVANTLSADTSNQGARLTAGTSNQDANLKAADLRRLAATSNQDANLKAADLRRLAATSNQTANLDASKTNQSNKLEKGKLDLGTAGALSDMALNKSNLGTNDANNMINIGGMQRDIDQAKLDVDYGNFLEERDWDKNNTNFLTGVLAGVPHNSTTTNNGTETTQKSGGTFGKILGGLSTAAGIAAKVAPMFSSKEYKEAKRPMKGALDGVRKLKVDRWKYKGEFSDQDDHIGPYAEDFRDAFGVGDGKTISMIDAHGVTLGALQELAEKVDRLEAERSGGALAFA